MQISFQPKINNNLIKQRINSNNFEDKKQNIKENSKKSFAKISTENIKANFCPTFGRFRIFDRVLLQNKNTMLLEPANIVKDTYGDTSLYKAMINRQEAGYMCLKFDSIIPEDDFLVMESDNNIPEVSYLRSLKGNDYTGIGTCLLHTAVQESKKYGRNGALWLNAERGYAYQASEYRSNESPIPFYYKLGFIAPDEKVHKQILECLEQRNYNRLPNNAILLLPSDRVHILEEYYASRYEMD